MQWCTHFETRCVLVMTDGPVVLFDYARHPFLAEGLPTIDEYRVMDAFYYFATGPKSGQWAIRFGKQINDIVSRNGGTNRRLAVDRLSHMGLIEPNMVLSVESYIGTENGGEGVKLEEMVLITETSVERLSSYPFEDHLLRY